MTEPTETRPPEGYEMWLEMAVKNPRRVFLADTGWRPEFLDYALARLAMLEKLPRRGRQNDELIEVRRHRDELEAERDALRARCEQLRVERDDWKQTAETLRAACRAEGEAALRAENAKAETLLRRAYRKEKSCGIPGCRSYGTTCLRCAIGEFLDARRALGNAQEARDANK